MIIIKLIIIIIIIYIMIYTVNITEYQSSITRNKIYRKMEGIHYPSKDMDDGRIERINTSLLL